MNCNDIYHLNCVTLPSKKRDYCEKKNMALHPLYSFFHLMVLKMISISEKSFSSMNRCPLCYLSDMFSYHLILVWMNILFLATRPFLSWPKPSYHKMQLLSEVVSFQCCAENTPGYCVKTVFTFPINIESMTKDKNDNELTIIVLMNHDYRDSIVNCMDWMHTPPMNDAG